MTRKLFVPALMICAALAATPALAATHHKHHVRHHAVAADSSVRIAQQHLHNLGYYTGHIDGAMGKQTRDAVVHFQRDHQLKPDGILGTKTKNALAYADHRVLGTHSFRTTDVVTSDDQARNYDMNTHPDYAASLNGGTKVMTSRFARVDVSESGGGPAKRYDVKVNGQPILIADGQPSIVDISQTYDLGNEDAIILTAFGPNGSGCVYSTHVLALNNQGSKLLDTQSCTRDYTAVAKDGSLFITFTQKDSGNAVGSVWRLEGTDLTRL